MSNLKSFLQKKDIEISFKKYGIDALSAMALGLFVSLIAGLIIKEVGLKLGLLFNLVNGIQFLVNAGNTAMAMTGPAIGVAIAFSLKAPPLVAFSTTVCGSIGYTLGGPVGAFVSTLFGVELGKVVSKETKIDIIITPIVTIIVGSLIAVLIGPSIKFVMDSLGTIINEATVLQPLPMGIAVSVIMGIILTLPISSAAIAISLGLTGLAAGASVAGCSAQMVGFAVISYKVNGIGGLVSQGIGTSMLQVPNIFKKPIIWLPVILTSAITGPLSTVVLKMTNIPTGAGMGTSGLVGQFGAFTSMGYSITTLVQILLIHFILPAILSYIFAHFMLKKGIIKVEDYKLDL